MISLDTPKYGRQKGCISELTYHSRLAAKHQGNSGKQKSLHCILDFLRFRKKSLK